MKLFWILLVCFVFLANTTPAQYKIALKSQKDSISYSIGVDLASSLKAQSVDIDQEILLRGFRDAFAGSKTLMTRDQITQALTTLQSQMMAKQHQVAKTLGEKNKKEGAAFLAENKKKEGVVTLPSGLQYKILKAGNGPIPKSGQSITANYRGTLLDGKEFDNSYKHGKPLTIGVDGVIRGWSEALKLMPVGSKWQLFIPSNLGYAETGQGPDIGPNATLIFELELLSVQ